MISTVLTESNACRASTSPAKGKKRVGLCPTRKRFSKTLSLNIGAVQRYCVTAPIILPGPTIPWALQMHTPLPRGAPHGRSRGQAWPPATCPRPMRHLRLAWATHGPATWPQCGVASARWSCVPRQLTTWTRSPRHHLRVSKPSFCDFE